MTINEIRLENLKRILREECNGVQKQLAERLDKKPTYISRVIKSDSHQKRNIGDDLARTVEKTFNKPHGWMDSRHGINEPSQKYNANKGTDFAPEMFGINNAELRETIIRSVPVLNAKQIIYGTEHQEKVPTILTNMGTVTAFGYVMQGESMVNPAGWPSIPPGSIIIVEPTIEAMPDKIIAVRDDNENVMIKKLVKDGENLLLMSLNPQYPAINLTNKHTCLGTITQIIYNI
jgi:SOS-response transcriptional repressor LexA